MAKIDCLPVCHIACFQWQVARSRFNLLLAERSLIQLWIQWDTETVTDPFTNKKKITLSICRLVFCIFSLPLIMPTICGLLPVTFTFWHLLLVVACITSRLLPVLFCYVLLHAFRRALLVLHTNCAYATHDNCIYILLFSFSFFWHTIYICRKNDKSWLAQIVLQMF